MWELGLSVGGESGVTPDNPKSVRWLVSIVREDYVTHNRRWTTPGFQALVVHRFGVWAGNQSGPIAKILGISYVVIHALVRSIYGIEMHRFVTIGRRVWIPHATGIVIHHRAQIGNDCLIRQGATLGLGGVKRPRRPPNAPKVGNGVEIGAGAVIVGGVTIGDGARIGPNAVVMTDIPAGASAFAAPAKVMKPLVENDEDSRTSVPEE